MALAILLGLGGSSASAALVHPLISSFGGGETPAGVMHPFGVAVDNSSSASAGDVYVSDRYVYEVPVNKFSASGSYLSQITGTPSGPFNFAFAQDAVDMSGDVFIGETGGQVVDEFGPTGAYMTQIQMPEESFPFAVAIDSSGNVLIAAANTVYKYDPTTSTLSPFVSGTPGGGFVSATGVAVDDDPSSPAYGDVYVADLGSAVVDVFDASGAYLSQLTGTPSGPFPPIMRDVVDPTSGDLYVTAENVIDEFAPTGAYLTKIDIPNEGSTNSVAVSATSGDIYSADVVNGVVDVFGPGLVLADVTSAPATDVRPTSATLHGHVDPAGGGRIRTCRFEYGTSLSYGEAIPCWPGNFYKRPADVTAWLRWLKPSTTYHFRLSASNANGASFSEDGTFETPALSPCEAVGHWSFARDPHGECRCAWSAHLQGKDCRQCASAAPVEPSTRGCFPGPKH